MPREPFVRDAEHWLYRHSGDEWIRAAMNELRRAEGAAASRNAPALVAAAKRAAGMALNGALVVRPDEAWGRSFVEHLAALAADASAPEAARDAARRLAALAPPTGDVINLRTPSANARVLEDARTVMAHAYAIVYGSTGKDRAS